MMASKFLGFNGALYALFNGVLGINAQNFNPLSAVTFSGGPHYQAMNYALQALPGGGYRSQVARSELARQLPRIFVPGSEVYRGVIEGVQYLEQGESYKGLMRIMSMPIHEDWSPSHDPVIPDFLPFD